MALMPQKSKHLRPILLGGKSRRPVSLACATGDHRACQGRIRLKEPDESGRRFARCGCPDCRHPDPGSLGRRPS